MTIRSEPDPAESSLIRAVGDASRAVARAELLLIERRQRRDAAILQLMQYRQDRRDDARLLIDSRLSAIRERRTMGGSHGLRR